MTRSLVGRLIITVLILLFVIMSSFLIDVYFMDHAAGLSCEKLGYTSNHVQKVVTDISHCKDLYGNVHFVDFNCTGFFWTRFCIAKNIQVGDVTGVLK